MRRLTYLLFILLTTACTTSPPRNSENICEIFREKDDWYTASQQAFQQWGVPVHVQMAIMYQESRFVADAEPPRPRLLGFIPWFRNSSAYGYAQAQDGTWEDFQQQTDSSGADRDNFTDSCHFIGWYCAVSHQKLGISKWDARSLYLAYHEGHNGFLRKSYRRKKWLLKTAGKVQAISERYRKQLGSCRKELEKSGWFFW